jgi:hypothetical protein
LISRIAEDRTRVVCPVIDIISDDTFAYVRSFELHWGAFNWELHFRWYTLGGGEIKRRKQDITEPFRYSLRHFYLDRVLIQVSEGWSHWPRGLSAGYWTQRPWVRIPLKAWMFVLIICHPIIDTI